MSSTVAAASVAAATAVGSYVYFRNRRAIPAIRVDGARIFVRNDGDGALIVYGTPFTDGPIREYLPSQGVPASPFRHVTVNHICSVAPRSEIVFLDVDSSASNDDIKQIRKVLRGSSMSIWYKTWYGTHHTASFNMKDYIRRGRG